MNLNATVVARGVYYPDARQVHWWIATDDASTPNLRLVLQTNEMRLTNEGYRRGWTIWDGPSATALAACLYATNVDETGDPRSYALKPVIGLEDDSLIQMTDVGDEDNGTAYEAHIRTKPYTPVGILHRLQQDWMEALMQNAQFLDDLEARERDRRSYYDLVQQGIL